MGIKWAPPEVRDVDPSLKIWGQMAEIVLLEYYLEHRKKKRIFPWSSTDFCDFTSGYANQTLYTAFLKMNNPKLSTAQLLWMRSFGLRKIPDFCVHDGMRTEYYECKPGSDSGIDDGLAKMAEIDAFNHMFDLEYIPGRRWAPTIDHVLLDDIIAGQPYTATLQFRVHKKGLIVWNVDWSSILLIPIDDVESMKKMTEAAARLLKYMIKKRLTKILNLSDEVEVGSVRTSQNVIGGSVGVGGQNQRPDVKLVQFLLNIPAREGSPPIKADGIVGKVTISAIREVQKTIMPNPDGLIEPGGPTLEYLAGLWSDRIDARLTIPMSAAAVNMSVYSPKRGSLHSQPRLLTRGSPFGIR